MLSKLPTDQSLISHSVRRNPNEISWIVDFYYPGCIRSYDGKNWTVINTTKTVPLR